MQDFTATAIRHAVAQPDVADAIREDFAEINADECDEPADYAPEFHNYDPYVI